MFAAYYTFVDLMSDVQIGKADILGSLPSLS